MSSITQDSSPLEGLNLDKHDVVKYACLYLMSQYAHQPCIAVASGVVQHLELLLLHPETRNEPENRKICMSTLEKWRQIVRKHAGEKKLITNQPAVNSIH